MYKENGLIHEYCSDLSLDIFIRHAYKSCYSEDKYIIKIMQKHAKPTGNIESQNNYLKVDNMHCITKHFCFSK